jgi:Putative phage tail protein
MVGSLIVAAIAETAVSAFAWYQTAAAFAINFAVSNLVSRAFAPDMSSAQAVDNGVRQQVPPSSTNSIPVAYGDAYMGGAFVDAVLSTDAKTMYYVLAISHISPNGQFTFDLDNMYWGDRKITFDATDRTKVVSLTDSAGNVDTKINGYLYIALYTSTEAGVISSGNGASAPSVFMGGADIASELQWALSNRQMNGLAFSIVKLNYNRDAETTSMQTVTYHIHHYLNSTGCAKPGDVWYDYMTNEKYGCAMSADLVDSSSATALNTYSDGLIPYTDNTGSHTQPRYRINGVIDTGQSCLNNINSIMIVCDSWNQYNAAKGQWSVVVNKESASSYAFNDSNIIGEIRVSAYDITSSVNQIEAEFPSAANRDQSDFVYYETPAGLLYPNEPINKQSAQFAMTNDSVQAQYLATRILEQAREDLIVNFSTAYVGIQVDAGDVITVTNSSYGWTAKPFRVMRVSEISLPDGNLGASFELNEYNAQVYDDKDITKYTPAPNTDLPDPSYFGVISAPTVASSYPSAAVPSFNVQPYMSAASFASYAEIWYSAFATPTASQMYLGGTTALPSNGVPYTVGQMLPQVNLSIPAGNWYLFSRIVNNIATSQFSSASSVFTWRPTTFQYTNRYLAIAYADNATGTSGFSYSPRNKAYYGLYNNTTANGGTDPTLYTWYQSPVNFSTSNYLLYTNRQNRKFSFNVGNAGYVNLGGAFVPTETSVYDTSLWSGLIDPTGSNQSFIDLDERTGQTIVVGTTSNNQNDGFLSVTNNTDGSMRVNLQNFLNFGAGVYTKSFTAATLTVDVYGRVVGFQEQDSFYYTETVYTATAGQTSFSNTHTVGWILVFRNGVLLDTTEYTETSTTVVMSNACVAGEVVVIIYMRGVSTSVAYVDTNMAIVSSTTNSITYSAAPWQIINAGDVLTFSNTGTPTGYTVSSINTTTKVITFTTTISGATAGNEVYLYRAAGSNYAPFSRYAQSVTSIKSFTPTTFNIQNGAESIYVNGSQINEIDYNITGTTIDGFPAPLTGNLTIILYAPNNLNVPASNIANTTAYSTSGQTTYPFPNNPLSMELYANGAILAKGSGYDYTASSANYILTSAFNNNSTLLNQQTFARIGAA